MLDRVTKWAFRSLTILIPQPLRERTRVELLSTFTAGQKSARTARGAVGVLLFSLKECGGLLRMAFLSRFSDHSSGRAASPARASGRDGHTSILLCGFAYDLRYGLRALARSRTFTVVAVLILGLGIGANSTMFTLVQFIFLQAPPTISAPEDLVALSLLGESREYDHFSYPDYVFYRDNNDVFSDVMAYEYGGVSSVAIGAGDDVVRAEVWTVSHNFFGVLGVAPAIGRSFLAEEDVLPGGSPVAMISHGFWRRVFGSDPSAVDNVITLNGLPFTIVGVVPRGFRGPNVVDKAPDLYVPLNMIGVLNPGAEADLVASDGKISLWLRIVGRMRPAVDREAVRAHMAVLRSRWESAFASWINATFWGDVEPYRVQLSPHFHLTRAQSEQLKASLTPLFLAVGLVLLIACANIAILLLARDSARQHEMGLRAALGAGRSRVVGQLMVESLLLAAVGGAVGFVVSYWGAGLAAGLIPMSFAVDFRPDIGVFGFTVALAGGAAILFGLAPAVQVSRADIALFLRRQGPGRGRANLRNVLVVGQLTLSIVLVTVAGLFVRSLFNAQRVDLGFEKERKLLMSVTPANHGYSEDEGKEFVRAILSRLEELPGVRSATTTERTPFRGTSRIPVTAPGTPYAEELFPTGFNIVGPGYFETLGVPILAGRGFVGTDDSQGPLAVVVNEHLAEQVWPGENAVGKTILRSKGGPEWTVVGVARDAVYYDIAEEPESQTYAPIFQDYPPRVTFVIATEDNPLALVEPTQQVIRDYDRHIAIFNVRTLEDVVANELGQFRVLAVLSLSFGVLALLLAAVGLYGVQSFLVARRTREIGIRIALGALQREVASTVLGRGLVLALIGVALGVTAAYAFAQLVQSQLFGVEARDLLTFVSVPVLLLLVAVAASLIPAMRASSVDPVEALRAE